jgi:hypothetical protein
MWTPIVAKLDEMIPMLVRDEHLALEADHVNNPASEYYGKPELFAREKFVYYMCAGCNSPYFGGRAVCGEDQDEVPPQKYLCKECERLLAHESCAKHGDAGMVYKCFWCCRPASWFCWGTTHFCTPCHDIWQRAQAGPYPACTGDQCSFHGHPPNGTKRKYGICRLCEEERIADAEAQPTGQ